MSRLVDLYPLQVLFQFRNYLPMPMLAYNIQSKGGMS